MDSSYDLVAVGSGFATSFFLHRFLAQQRANYRVLVLEMGQEFSHQERLARRKELEFRDLSGYFLNRTPEKQWVFQPAFGGGSNCWMACTPRMMPEDFQLAAGPHDHSVEAADERRFARSVRPQQSHAFPGAHLDIKRCQRLKVTKTLRHPAGGNDHGGVH